MKRYTLRLIYFIISQKLEFCNTHRTNFKLNSHYVNLLNILDTTKQEALLLYLVNIAMGKSDLCYKTECLKIINRYPMLKNKGTARQEVRLFCLKTFMIIYCQCRGTIQ